MSEFFQEYVQQYLQNIIFRKQLKQLIRDKNELLKQIETLEQTEPPKDNFEERKKRLRSLACQIERNFECPMNKCGKKYGSEGSLNQHIKLKHPELCKL